MHVKFLLFLTLIFMGTCTGHGYVQQVKPQSHSDSSVIRAPLASAVFSRNGSTLEDIMDMR